MSLVRVISRWDGDDWLLSCRDKATSEETGSKQKPLKNSGLSGVVRSNMNMVRFRLFNHFVFMSAVLLYAR